MVLTADLLPVGTMPQLLLTLLAMGVLVLVLTTPGLMRRRRVRRFQERVWQRDHD